MNLDAYREAVRSVSCPECAAPAGEPCRKSLDEHGVTTSDVTYVHDDRSLAYHEALLRALRVWLEAPLVVRYVPATLAADLDQLVSDAESGQARFELPDRQWRTALEPPGAPPAECSLCRRKRTDEGQDAVDYHPAQVLSRQPLGWYSGDDGEVCPGCMALTLARQ